MSAANRELWWEHLVRQGRRFKRLVYLPALLAFPFLVLSAIGTALSFSFPWGGAKSIYFWVCLFGILVMTAKLSLDAYIAFKAGKHLLGPEDSRQLWRDIVK
jgi:uncharacterized membrane protein